jgi:hypothetical protein
MPPFPTLPKTIRPDWRAGFRRAAAAGIFDRKVNEALRLSGRVNASYSNDLIDFCARGRI